MFDVESEIFTPAWNVKVVGSEEQVTLVPETKICEVVIGEHRCELVLTRLVASGATEKEEEHKEEEQKEEEQKEEDHKSQGIQLRW